MARIRTIKPQFFVNEQLAGLGYGDRLLFIGLWTQADKAGRLEYRPLRIKAALFPYDNFDVAEALDRLISVNLITRYEGDGMELLSINTWAKHQRPHKTEAESELPPAPLSNRCEHVTKTLEGKGREGKGREGNKEGKGTDSAGAGRTRFERFWSEYPRKEGKDAAWKEWLKRSPDDDLTDLMILQLHKQRASAQWLRDGGQYIPHPRTWLHQGRWQDEGTPQIPQLSDKAVKNLRGIYGD